MTIQLNEKVKNFNIQTTDANIRQLSDFKGQNLVLYFYPKDATPGCTLEGRDFKKHYQEFKKLNTVIFGVSKDTLASHEKFKTKECFPFELISDVDQTLCQYFNVLKEKSMFGKKYIGIERSTFIIDENQVLRHEWRKVNVLAHAKSVLKELEKTLLIN